MPFENPEGPEIIPAGEVSTYVLCPESWRLEYLEKAAKYNKEVSSKGKTAHTDWQIGYDELTYLIRSKRILIWLFLLLILFGLLVAN